MQKTALVTGAAKGLGAALAETLHHAGYSVILHYWKSKDEVTALAERLGATHIVQADITNPAEVDRLFQEIPPVDILINNVGDFIFTPLLETPVSAFDSCIHNNLMSAWYCMKQVLPHMQEQNWGRIINFGCTNCDQLTIRPNTTPYYIAKTGLLMLTKELATELRTTGITINMISPGVLPTGMSAGNPDVPIVPFDAIAQAMLFLIDEKNTHITGANLEVNAGWRPQ